MSKARDLSNFISDATVDATEIADLAVTHAKLHTDMNLSSKTLTFAANQISGNSVDGGVISNFASTGIDDNASSTAVTILSDGKVGIGITSPIRQLHLASSVPSIRLEDTDVSGAYNDIVHLATGELSIRVDHGNVQSNSSLSFLIDADEKMRIDTSGRVGIGTDNPTVPLHIVSSSTTMARFVGSNVGNLYITNDSDNVMTLQASTNTALSFNTSGSHERMRIEASGNVGIGSTSPDAKLDVTRVGDGTIAIFQNTGLHGFEFSAPSSTALQIASRQGSKNLDLWANTLSFSAGGSGSMHIASSGNVGIGLAIPDYKLDVGGIGTTQLRLKSSGDTGYTQGSMVIESSDSSSNTGNRGQGVYYYNVPNQRTWYAGTLYNNGNKFGFGYRQVSGFQVDAADNLHAVMVIDGDSTEVGIGVTNPSATLHVEDDGTGGNSGHMKLGHTRTRTFYAGIASSENRWYKVLNYSTGNMFTGKVQIYITRSGGFNQTGAHKEYRASLGGYSNSVYGPLSLSGDTGEGGVASLEIGTDAGVYLRVNQSIYGGAVYVTFSGQGNMSWAYSNSSYSTSLP